MKNLLLIFIFLIFLSTGAHAFAAEYIPMVAIPFADTDASTSDYINALYRLSITVAALIAVVKIIFGGVKWMLSDVVTDKASAKKDIKGALLGLLIVLSAVLILNTINTDLTKINFLTNVPAIDPQATKIDPADAVIGRTLTGGSMEAVENFKATCPGKITKVFNRAAGITLKCL